MTVNNERFTISLDKEMILAISSIASKNGQSKSYVVARMVKDGLKNSPYLTFSERYRWSISIIQDTIDMLFKSVNMKYDGDLLNSIIILYCIPENIFRSKKERELFKASILQIIDDLEKIDNDMSYKIIEILKGLNHNVIESMKSRKDLENSEKLEIPNDFEGDNII